MQTVLVVWKIPVLMWGALLAIQTRQLFDEGFNEATWMAGSVWITALALVLQIPLSAMAWTGDTFSAFFHFLTLLPFGLVRCANARQTSSSKSAEGSTD